VDKEYFATTWDNFKTVARFFKRNRQMYKLRLFDWEKAYHQILTSIDQWPFLMVHNFKGKVRIVFCSFTVRWMEALEGCQAQAILVPKSVFQ
jgi:hypothetical protein